MIDVGKIELNPGQVHWPSKSCLLSYLENVAYKNSYFFFGSKIALLGGTAGDLSSLLFPILNTLWLWGQFGDFVELKAWVWPLWERGWCRGPRAGPTDRWQRRRKAVTKLWPKANLTAPLSKGTRWRTDRLYADCSTHKLERHPTQVLPSNRDVHCTIL